MEDTELALREYLGVMNLDAIWAGYNMQRFGDVYMDLMALTRELAGAALTYQNHEEFRADEVRDHPHLHYSLKEIEERLKKLRECEPDRFMRELGCVLMTIGRVFVNPGPDDAHEKNGE